MFTFCGIRKKDLLNVLVGKNTVFTTLTKWRTDSNFIKTREGQLAAKQEQLLERNINNNLGVNKRTRLNAEFS